MSSKNFVVSFNNNNGAYHSLFAAYYRQIMDIMLYIDTCSDYDTAMNSKIGYIQNYLTNDSANIEYIIYIYGFAEALTEYKQRFGNRDIEPSILTLDLATLIIDKIITIYEVYSADAVGEADVVDEADVVGEAGEAFIAYDHEYDSDDSRYNVIDDNDSMYLCCNENKYDAEISSIYCDNPTEASLNVVDENALSESLSSTSLSGNDTDDNDDNDDNDDTETSLLQYDYEDY